MSKPQVDKKITDIHRDIKNLTQIGTVQGSVNVKSRFVFTDIKDVVSKSGDLLADHLYIFLQILVNPKTAFIDLLSPLQKDSELAKTARSIVKPFLYATINLAIAALLASTLPIKTAPDMTMSSFIMPVALTQIVMLTIYALPIHSVMGMMGGKGTIYQTLAGLYYVIGTLQPLIVIILFLSSTIFPNIVKCVGYLEYWQTTPDKLGNCVDVLGKANTRGLYILNFGLTTFFWLVTMSLILIYLSHSLKIAHEISGFKILLSYFLGLILWGLLATSPYIIMFILYILGDRRYAGDGRFW